MSRTGRPTGSGNGPTLGGMKSPTSRRGRRARRLAAVLLLVMGSTVVGCTPEQIEASAENIAVSFEEGGAERGLAEAVFVMQMAIPIVGMRLGSAFGP